MENENIEVEREVKPITFKTAFYIVLALHLVAGIGIFGFTQRAKAQTISSDKEFLKTAEYVGIEEPKEKVKSQDFYLVKKGDTLYSIARKNKTSLNNLISLNKIKDVNKITIGQKLKLN